jgi:hypothetical protein
MRLTNEAAIRGAARYDAELREGAVVFLGFSLNSAAET